MEIPVVAAKAEAPLQTEILDLGEATPQISNAASDADDNLVNPDIKQRQYIPKSQVCDTVETVAPVSLLYEMRKNLAALDHKVRGVDEYVRTKLGYKTLIDLCSAFSAEQVDALALTIYNGEENGYYLIEGDMTGIGKGRVAAGLMRYAAVTLKLKPIFLTAQSNLFSDIFRDMIDIKFDDGIPLEINTGKTRERAKRVSQKEIVDAIKADVEDGDYDLQWPGDTLFQEARKEDLKAAIEEYRTLYFPNDIVTETVYQTNHDYEHDIAQEGVKRFVPFILNANDIKSKIYDSDGNIIYEPHTGKEIGDKNAVIASGELPEGYDCLMLTYSQIASAKAQAKRDFVMKLATDNILVLDEAHLASGDSNTGRFMRELIEVSRWGMFLSATYAKRPENMALYSPKTCLRDAELDPKALVSAIESGGLPLQEIISSELASEGQMLRRERSFEGTKVTYNYFDRSMVEEGIPEFDLKEQHSIKADKCTEIVRDIMRFQKNHVEPIIGQAIEDLKAEMGNIKGGQTGQQKEATINNPPIFNGVFNLINQLLFAIKAEPVADYAVMRMREGKKPVIAFSSTMESFLDYLQENNTEDTIPTDFSIVLKRRLDKTMTYRIDHPSGESEQHSIDPESMSAAGQNLYYEILKKIDDTTVGIKISPIDTILDRIKAAGFTVGEVTGRNKYVQYLDNGRGKIKSRQKPSPSQVFRKFNENELDCIIINQAGSTGASAHAVKNDKVFEVEYMENNTPIVPNSLDNKKQVKQRTMLLLQAELDTSKEVQKRGRINRTGQVFKPQYEYLISAIPAETRLMMMMQKKLKSLDSNTSGNQKQSSAIVSVVDFLNKYGDQVVLDFLKRNLEINELTGNVANLDESGNATDTTAKEGLAHRVSGRVAILSCEQQNTFYEEIIKQYVQLEDDLRNRDEWDLELIPMELKADTIRKNVVEVGNPESKSVFGGPVWLEECWVDNLRKPFTADEVWPMINKTLTLKSESNDYSDTPIKASVFSDRLLAELDTFMAERKALDMQGIAIWRENEIEKARNSKALDKIAEIEEKTHYWNDSLAAIDVAQAERITMLEKRHDANLRNRSNIISFFKPGRPIKYPVRLAGDPTEYDVDGIVVGLTVNKAKWTLSDMQIVVVFPSALKRVAIAGSLPIVETIINHTNNDILFGRFDEYKTKRFMDKWDESIKDSLAPRLKRLIVTGNLLKALGMGDYIGGKLISYTTIDGKIKRGILVSNETKANEAPVSMDPATRPVKVPIYTMLDKILTMKLDERFVIDGGAYMQRKEKYYRIYIVKKSPTQQTIPVSTDKQLQEITIQGKYEMKGGEWQADITPEMMEVFVTILWEKYSIRAEVSRALFETIKDQFDIEERGGDEKQTDSAILGKYEEELTQYEQQQVAEEFRIKTEAEQLAMGEAERQAYAAQAELARLRFAHHMFMIWRSLQTDIKERKRKAKVSE